MNNKRLLVFAEYISLGLSVLGTILASVTGQVGLAATPLTLALSLNLINRKELTKRTFETKKNDIVLLEGQIQNLDNSLQAQIEKIISSCIKKDELEKRYSDLQTWTRKQLTDSLKQVTTNIGEINHKFALIESRSNKIEQENTLTIQDIERIEANVEQLKNSNQANELNLEIALFNEKLKSLENQLHNPKKAQIEKIISSCIKKDELEKRYSDLQTWTRKQLTESLKQVTTNIGEINHKFVSIESRYNKLKQENTLTIQDIERIEANVEQFKNSNQANELNLEIALFNEKLKSLENQLHNSDKAQIEKIISSCIKKDELEKRCTDLQTWTTKQLTESLKQVTTNIGEINHKFALIESRYHELASKQDLDNALNNLPVYQENNSNPNINQFKNASPYLDEIQPQQQTTNFAPPKVPNKYRRESFSDNQSKTQSYSKDKNHETRNSFESKPIGNNTLPRNEIERGIHEITKGVQEIGDSIFREFKN